MLERKKRYTEPAGRKEWSDGGQKGTNLRRSRSCFWQIKPENSVGKFSGCEAVHLSLDEYLIDVKPFFDTVVRVNYSSGFPAVPPGDFENIHAKQLAVPVQTGNLKGPFHKGDPFFSGRSAQPVTSLRQQRENRSESGGTPSFRTGPGQWRRLPRYIPHPHRTSGVVYSARGQP